MGSLLLAGQPPREEPIFEEALYLSSPELWSEYKKRDALTGKKRDKLTLSLHKYWLRGCTRATPYATFAGSTLVDMEGKPTSLVLDAPGAHRRSVRLDMNYVAQLVHVLTEDPATRGQLRFLTNNSLYTVGDTYRYVEYTIANNVRKYQLTSIERTPYLNALLEAGRHGRRLEELRVVLMETEQVTAEEADGFLLQLCEAQLLLSELEPCVTGEEPIDRLIGQLSALLEPPAVLSDLRHIRDLTRLPQHSVESYVAIDEALRRIDLPGGVPRNTLQTDLYLSAAGRTLDKTLVEALLAQASDLMYLSRRHQNADLNDFKNAFVQRWEEAEVPLSIALDGDVGVGYAGVGDELAGENEWLDGLPHPGGDAGSLSNDFIQQFVLDKYHDFLRHGRTGIFLEEQELKALADKVSGHRFPGQLFLMGSLLSADGVLDKDHFLFDLSSFGGPGAANLFGRFTHGDPDLCRFTQAILREEEEQQSDILYAEVAHLPQARIGNVILRPVLRRFEIPYVGASGAAGQIPVDDLLISVRQGQVVLRSKTHGKRVLPRLTSAHNYSHNSLPVYKFLCDLQLQDLAMPNIWDWGAVAPAPFLPRVTYKNIILRKARWIVEERAVRDIAEFRRQWNVPGRVVYAEADNELLIDFDTAAGVALFTHYLQRHKRIMLEEFLFTEENCVVRDGEGRAFTNELIIPVRLEGSPASGAGARGGAADVRDGGAPEPAAVQRKFIPGSEWLYYKIYCGRKTGETLLKKLLLPFVRQEGLFEHFFFIRYKDDFSHLRIRFYNSDPRRHERLREALTPLLHPFIESGLVDKVVLDTYTRELERYGDYRMADVERMFGNDSRAVLGLIDLFEGAEGEKYRLLFALRGTDALLDDFHFTLGEKRSLFQGLQKGFFQEFGGQLRLQQTLNEKYRNHQKWLFSHMDPALDDQNEIREGTDLLTVRSRMNAPIITRIGGGAAFVQSLIHMYLNRLFIAQPRKHELVVYHFLEKYYASQLAITAARLPAG